MESNDVNEAKARRTKAEAELAAKIEDARERMERAQIIAEIVRRDEAANGRHRG